MTEATFRPARKEDAPAILVLIRHLASVEQRPEAVTVDVAAVERLIADANSAATVTVMLDANAHVIGYAMTARKFSTFRGYDIVYIEDIVLSPAVQGQGFGRFFMAELARQTLDSGAKRLEWSAEDVNSGAIGFYDKMNAERETDRIHFLMNEERLKALVLE